MTHPSLGLLWESVAGKAVHAVASHQLLQGALPLLTLLPALLLLLQSHEEYMRRAIQLSEKAGLIEKTGGCFGAVIVDKTTGEIIGEGYNHVGPSFPAAPRQQSCLLLSLDLQLADIAAFNSSSTPLCCPQVIVNNDPTW